jgi:hypothetical protein
MRQGNFGFKNRGIAFVDALEQRKSTFGSLGFDGMPFSRPNLERLLILEGTFDRLSLSVPKEDFVVDAFSAKVNAFHYTVNNRARRFP